MMGRRHAAASMAMAGALLGPLAACTPMRSTLPPPYPLQGAEYGEAEIQALAALHCEATRPDSDPPPPYPYTTDGCSMVPDGMALECCIAHDIEYWCGGSLADRLHADRNLRQCVAERTGPARARLMFLGVRAGGWPRVPFGWRWGYGHPWPFRPDREP